MMFCCKFCDVYLGLTNTQYYCNDCSHIRRIVKLFGTDSILEILKEELFNQNTSDEVKSQPEKVKNIPEKPEKPLKDFTLEHYPFLTELEKQFEEKKRLKEID